jgi:hypothetical protein
MILSRLILLGLIKSINMRWWRHVACKGKCVEYLIPVNLGWKGQKIDLGVDRRIGIKSENSVLIELFQDRVQCDGLLCPRLRTFDLFKPWLNSCSCVNRSIVVLENRRYSEITSGLWMHMITQPVHIVLCSNSAINGNNGTSRILYHDTAARTITDPSSVFHCWNQAFRIVGFLECSPNVNSSWCREQREGHLISPYHVRISSCLMSRLYGLTSSFTHLSITFPLSEV